MHCDVLMVKYSESPLVCELLYQIIINLTAIRDDLHKLSASDQGHVNSVPCPQILNSVSLFVALQISVNRTTLT